MPPDIENSRPISAEYGKGMEKTYHGLLDEATYIRWLSTVQHPEVLKHQLRAAPIRIWHLIARCANANAFTEAQIHRFLQDETTRTGLLMNPTLSDAQIKMVLDWALEEFLNSEYRFFEQAYYALESSGHRISTEAWRAKLRSLLSQRATEKPREDNRSRRTAEAMLVFWSDLTLEDLEAVSRWASATHLRSIALHPGTSEKLLLQIWNRAKYIPSEPVTEIMEAVAQHPLVKKNIVLYTEVLGSWNPRVLAAAMIHFPTSEAEKRLAKSQSSHRKRGWRFLWHCPKTSGHAFALRPYQKIAIERPPSVMLASDLSQVDASLSPRKQAADQATSQAR